MAGKTLDIDDIIKPDLLGTSIANKWMEWNTLRQNKITDLKEIRKYLFATDTTQTTNSQLPWSNKTTVPKLTQIRDNLFANYVAAMFPKRKWLHWEGETAEDEEKGTAIEDYMRNVVERTGFQEEMKKLVLDFIDYGNAFATVEWVDERSEQEGGKVQKGYVGPRPRRISPLDITFNPIAPSFEESPKIIRSLVSLGEVKEMLQRMTKDTGQQELFEEMWDYIKNIREHITGYQGNVHVKDEFLQVDGFESYRAYLESGVVEVLTFYGDMYDEENDEFLKNHVITVVDRHKIVQKVPNPSFFGQPPIYHVGWRIRQDNLWAMGPLDNLVGLQYRIDHLENMKADVYDVTRYPVFKIQGYVDDFEWGPGERIYVGDGGDVEMMVPDVRALEANFEIDNLTQLMEAMAGAPKEALGIRTPGEKTAFEVSRLENAASRIFQSKIGQFETQMTERLLNSMLELSRRNMTAATVRVIDDEFKMARFEELTPTDLTGTGRLRPRAAQHFAEKANRFQSIVQLSQTPLMQDPQVLQHFSSVKVAELVEDLLDLEDAEIVQPYIRISEMAEAQRESNAQEEQVLMEAGTPSGLEGEGALPTTPPPEEPAEGTER